MPKWNDGSLRMVARAVLVVLLLTFCTPFTLFSEGRQYVTQSHDESSHHYIVPLPGDEASASVPVILQVKEITNRRFTRVNTSMT